MWAHISSPCHDEGSNGVCPLEVHKVSCTSQTCWLLGREGVPGERILLLSKQSYLTYVTMQNLYVSHLYVQETRLLVKRVNTIRTVQYGPILCCSSPYIFNGASPELYYNTCTHSSNQWKLQSASVGLHLTSTLVHLWSQSHVVWREVGQNCLLLHLDIVCRYVYIEYVHNITHE